AARGLARERGRSPRRGPEARRAVQAAQGLRLPRADPTQPERQGRLPLGARAGGPGLSTRRPAPLGGEAREVRADRRVGGRERARGRPVAARGGAAVALEVAGVAAVDERGEVGGIGGEARVEGLEQALVLPEVAVRDAGAVG